MGPAVFDALVALLQPKVTQSVQEAAVGALRNLAAKDAENKERIGAVPGAFEALVRILKHGSDSPAQDEAATALSYLTKTESNLQRLKTVSADDEEKEDLRTLARSGTSAGLTMSSVLQKLEPAESDPKDSKRSNRTRRSASGSRLRGFKASA